ncbi:MAG TPA: hypothetical protein VME40_14640 [Caulobacteraceae bacterium]|nr:hypothetical protein [Caulobacteraceae bacterium]
MILVKIDPGKMGYILRMPAQAFRVVRDAVGWTVCFGEAVTSSFRTRQYAIQEAHRLCEALRMHGLDVQVVVEDEEPGAVAPLVRSRGAALLPH